MVPGSGLKAQSEPPQATVTGKLEMTPTLYFKISKASMEVIRPSPDTSQAMFCISSGANSPTAICKAASASAAVIALLSSPAFCACSDHLPDVNPVIKKNPELSVGMTAGPSPSMDIVTSSTG